MTTTNTPTPRPIGIDAPVRVLCAPALLPAASAVLSGDDAWRRNDLGSASRVGPAQRERWLGPRPTLVATSITCPEPSRGPDGKNTRNGSRAGTPNPTCLIPSRCPGPQPGGASRTRARRRPAAKHHLRRRRGSSPWTAARSRSGRVPSPTWDEVTANRSGGTTIESVVRRSGRDGALSRMARPLRAIGTRTIRVSTAGDRQGIAQTSGRTVATAPTQLTNTPDPAEASPLRHDRAPRRSSGITATAPTRTSAQTTQRLAGFETQRDD
jgi:hypothetical protein